MPKGQKKPRLQPLRDGLKPAREHATNNAQTYFITSKTWEGRALFSAEPWARLFFKTMLGYRGEGFLLHEFVLMPDHFHLLVTPLISLERAVQLIKGGFSFRAKKELGSNAEIWQRGFSDHRLRDGEDYEKHVHYIHLNPVKKHLCARAEEYRYSSAYPGWKLDPVPQGLKPVEFRGELSGTAEAVPFQNMKDSCGTAEDAPFQNMKDSCGTAEDAPFQNMNDSCGTTEDAPFQTIKDSFGTAEVVPFQAMKDSFGTAEVVPFQNITN